MDALFWSKVDRSGGPNACWPYGGYRNAAGYGRLTRRGRGWNAHRWAYRDANGEFPAELDVLHSCDNPPCCNPSHLRLGNDFDNQRDVIARGRRRMPRGDAHPARRIPGLRQGARNGRARLTEDDVRRLRAASRDERLRLGRQLGISTDHARRVAVGLAWSHLS